MWIHPNDFRSLGCPTNELSVLHSGTNNVRITVPMNVILGAEKVVDIQFNFAINLPAEWGFGMLNGSEPL